MKSLDDKILGCIVGGAVGDAMGIPFEGTVGPVTFTMPTNWQVSDDTQLTLATCEAIVEDHLVSPEIVARHYSRWFSQRRITGMGASTLKALRELEAGGHWSLVGRKGEMAAGNGAAMRAAPLAFVLDPNSDTIRTRIRDICRITHHNEEAYVGALAVVRAIRFITFHDQSLDMSLLSSVSDALPDSRVRDRICEVAEFLKSNSLENCATRHGSSGYVVESVPLALAGACFAANLGITKMMQSLIECGGDTDTIASMAGQIAGAAYGFQRIPTKLVSRLPDWEGIHATAHAFARAVRAL